MSAKVYVDRSDLERFYNAAVEAADTLWKVAQGKQPVTHHLKRIGSAIHEMRTPIDLALGLTERVEA